MYRPVFVAGPPQNDRAMDGELLAAREAAARLGIKVTTLYDWLEQSDFGLLKIRGQRVEVRYFQGGGGGHGRIQIEASEVDRIHELMRVKVCEPVARRAPVRRDTYPGINVPLGRPRPNQGPCGS